MPLLHKKELAASVLAASLALPLFSAPAAYTQAATPIVLGPVVGTAPAAGFTVAMPVSGSDRTTRLHKRGQLNKKHTGS